MMRVMLFRLHHGAKLRQDHCGDSGVIDVLHFLRMIRCHQFYQFHLDPLRTDLFQISAHVTDGLFCPLLNGKTKLCCKTDCTEHTQCILRKTFCRFSHASDPLCVQICNAVKGIHQTGLIVVCHCIDGKIPAFQIFQQIGSKNHVFRMACILIFAVNTVSSDLKSFLIHQNCHGTMLDPGVHGSWKNRLHLMRFGRRRNIPVSGGTSKDTVSDTAAHSISIITMCFQFSNDGLYFFR